MLRIAIGLVWCVVLAAGPAAANQQAVASPGVNTLGRSINAVAVPVGSAPVRVDGQFDEAVWQSAPPVGGFLQREPQEGATTTHSTEVRVAYDADAIYVAVRAHDPEPDRVVGHLTRRDDMSPSDWIAVLIDSFNDKRTAYEFAVNVAGVKYRPLLVQRHEQRSGMGRGVGRGHIAHGRRLAGRVPHRLLPAALPRHRHGIDWLRHHADRGASE